MGGGWTVFSPEKAAGPVVTWRLRRQWEACLILPGMILVRILLCPFQEWTVKQYFVKKKEHLVSISFRKPLPIKAEKKLAWVQSFSSLLVQPLIKAIDDLQTMEPVPAAWKTHSRPLLPSHSGTLSSQWGRVGWIQL